MKALNKAVLSFILLLLTGLTACSDDSNSSDTAKASKQEIHEIFLQGTVSGHLNGEAFTFGSPEGRDSKLRKTGNSQ